MSATFKVTLTDDVSRNANRAAKSVKNLRNKLRGAKGGAAGTSGAFAGIKSELTGLKLAATATAAAVGVVALKFAKSALQSAAFMEQNRLAFGLMLKGSEAGGKALEEVRDIATELGLPVQQTIKDFRKLLAMQFKPQAAKDIVKLGADMRALGATSEEVSSIIRAMTQIKAKGKLQAEELTGQLAEAGVSAELVYQQLGKTMGKTTEEVRKMITAGKVDADVALDAIQKAILQKLGTKAPGEAAKAFTGTMGGMWAQVQSQAENAMLTLGDRIGPRVKEIFGPIGEDIKAAFASPEAGAAMDQIIERFDIVETAINQIKAATAGFTEGFSAAWESVGPLVDKAVKSILELAGSGDALKDIKSTFKIVGGVAAVALGVLVTMAALATAAIAGFAQTAVRGVDSVTEGWDHFVDWAEGLPDDISEAFGDAGETVSGFFEDLGGSISEGAEGLAETASQLGSDIIDGIVEGIESGASAVVGAITDTANQAIQAAKDALDISSPSKVFEGIGRNVAQGFAGGVRAEEGLVAASTAQTVAASAQSAASVTNNITARVNAGSTNNITGAASPEATAAAIGQIQLGDLGAAFEQLGNTMGAAVG